MFDELLRELQTGVRLLLLFFVAGVTAVFVITNLPVVLNADAPTFLLVLGAALFVLLIETMRNRRHD